MLLSVAFLVRYLRFKQPHSEHTKRKSNQTLRLRPGLRHQICKSLLIYIIANIPQAFVLQHVIDKHRCLRAPLYLCFVDLKSAYDRVQWPLLWDLLRRLGVQGKMLGAVQSLYDNCLLSMRVSGFTGEGKTPSMGLRQGCPLSATLFGLFIDGLHHYLETVVPAAGIQIQHMRLRELVYADDICLMASSPEHLQALIDALSSYCAVLHMEISVPKTKVLIVSPVPVPAVAFHATAIP